MGAIEEVLRKLSLMGNSTKSYKEILYLTKEEYGEYIKSGNVIIDGEVCYGPWRVKEEK